ncbi:MAG: hypothetical protein IT581_14345 [Verrucomicrobiales bacterium]|nr:hypothetical protein [Verrucomicrobiales bacterium]
MKPSRIVLQLAWALFCAALTAQLSSACAETANEADEEAMEFVEFGTHKTNVVRLMGKPERIAAFESIGRETLYYGDAQVELFKSAVVGWKNSGNPMIWMGDPQPDAAAVEVGSLPEQVIAVMGTPEEIEYDRKSGNQNWRYGSSGIRIAGGKVADWSDFGRLKVGKLERPATVPVPWRQPTTSAVVVQLPEPPPAVAEASSISTTSRSVSKSYGGSVRVKGYTRRDGTYVRPHTRRR